ncbi:hypothetical protein [Teredinibacter turnerae]|nr:hypothetical protein [Teredinibacter turnerae]
MRDKNERLDTSTHAAEEPDNHITAPTANPDHAGVFRLNTNSHFGAITSP